MRFKPLYVFIALCIMFIAYSGLVYTIPLNTHKDVELSDEAIKGKAIWQKHNCQSCHQIYGLGGYLGPDLTNLTSNATKNENYIRAMLRSNIKQMPVFNLTDNEVRYLTKFLESINKTGSADQTLLKESATGMVE